MQYPNRTLTFLIFVNLVCFTFTGYTADLSDTQILEVALEEKGFKPHLFHADPDKLTVLKVTRSTPETCTLALTVKEKKIKRKLPLHKAIMISIGKLDPGELKFQCEKGLASSGLIYVK